MSWRSNAAARFKPQGGRECRLLAPRRFPRIQIVSQSPQTDAGDATDGRDDRPDHGDDRCEIFRVGEVSEVDWDGTKREQKSAGTEDET